MLSALSKVGARRRLFPSLIVAASMIVTTPLHGQTSTSAPSMPALDQLRPLWQPGESRYIRSWQIRSTEASSSDEAALAPGPGWTPYTAWTDPGDLAAIAGGAGTANAPRRLYAFATVVRDEAGTADLAIGAGARVTAWVNGVAVGAAPAGPFVRDRTRLRVTLKKGENRILLRFDNTTGDWRLSVRLLEPEQPLPQDRHLTPLLWSDKDALVVRTDARSSNKPALVSVLAPGGQVVAEASASRGDEVRIPLARLPDRLYDIRVSSTDAWNRPIVAYTFWGNQDRVAAARALLSRAAAATGADIDAAHWRLLGALVADRAGADLSRLGTAIVEPALFEAAELAIGPGAAIHASGFVRLGWIDPVDGSTQFCRAYLPADYQSGRSWPTVLYLHGFNPANPPLVGMWGVDARHYEETADRHSVIWIEPHGRGNTGYTGIGEADVLHCLDEARRRLSVDDGRTYLLGESMGGMGTWLLGTRHPERWAAIAPVYGGVDPRIKVGAAAAAALPLSPTERWMLQSASSFNGAEALVATPVFVHQGDEDKAVDPRFARAIVGQMQRWGYDVRYREYPGLGHEDIGERDEVIDWFLRHRRAEPPRHVRVRSADLDGAGAWWLRVEGAQQPMAMIEADAEVTEPGVVRLDTRNVAAVTLTLPAALVNGGKALRVAWNGQLREAQLDAQGRATLHLPDAPSGSALKRPGLAGGLATVFTTPHAIVVGTISRDPVMRRVIRERAAQRAAAWAADQHVRPRLVDDTAVTPAMERSLSLVLIGGADANAVTRRLARQLPMKVERTAVTVDGRRFAATDAVLEMVRPSPWAADRYILVVAATSPGGMHVWNPAGISLMSTWFPTRLWDWTLRDGRVPLLPDPQLPDRGWISSGVWDQGWRRDDRWTFLGDPALRAAATLRRLPPPGFTLPVAVLDRYVGRYELYPGMAATVRRNQGQLVLDLPGRPPVPLVPEREALFSSPDVPGSIEFRLGTNGDVSEARLDNGTSVSIWPHMAVRS